MKKAMQYSLEKLGPLKIIPDFLQNFGKQPMGLDSDKGGAVLAFTQIPLLLAAEFGF